MRSLRIVGHRATVSRCPNRPKPETYIVCSSISNRLTGWIAMASTAFGYGLADPEHPTGLRSLSMMAGVRERSSVSIPNRAMRRLKCSGCWTMISACMSPTPRPEAPRLAFAHGVGCGRVGGIKNSFLGTSAESPNSAVCSLAHSIVRTDSPAAFRLRAMTDGLPLLNDDVSVVSGLMHHL
jgi:hypothetical protein